MTTQPAIKAWRVGDSVRVESACAPAVTGTVVEVRAYPCDSMWFGYTVQTSVGQVRALGCQLRNT